MKRKIQDLLLRSMDNMLLPDEKIQLNQALQHSESLKREKESMESIRHTLSQSRRPQFRPFFTDRVLRRIDAMTFTRREDPFFNALKHTFRPILFTAAILIVVIISFNAVRNDASFIAGLFGTNEIGLEETFDLTYEWIQE